MKKYGVIMLFAICCFTRLTVSGQCAICTKTSMQQGEKAGKGMNGGIVYLMLMPLAIMSYIGYRWWKQEKR